MQTIKNLARGQTWRPWSKRRVPSSAVISARPFMTKPSLSRGQTQRLWSRRRVPSAAVISARPYLTKPSLSTSTKTGVTGHSEKETVLSPEGCRKILTISHAIKKHLQSQWSELKWPYECPICHNKFQARGDIPKYLQTKLHENNNILVRGSKVKIQAYYIFFSTILLFNFYHKCNSILIKE